MRGSANKSSRFVAVSTMVVILIVVACWFLSHRATPIDATSLQARVNQIGAQLRAPSDHNSMTVATSPIPQAERMRYAIQQDVLQGMSNGQVIAAMVAQYGNSVLAAPRFQGFGAWAWVLPSMVVLFGIFIYGLYVIRHTRREGMSSLDENPASSMELEVERHLKDYL